MHHELARKQQHVAPTVEGEATGRMRMNPVKHMMTWARWLVCALLFFGISAAAGAQTREPVPILTISGAIDPASADYVVRGLRHAQENGAQLVVLRMDTPGGLDSAMRQIVQAILASTVPVATYVGPEGARAASAGTYILYASPIAAMAPATTLGAATPVAIGMRGPGAEPPAPAPASTPPEGDTLAHKQINDAAAFIRGLAQRHDRNAEWAESAVREAVTLTASEALREKVVDLVAADVPSLLMKIDGRRVVMPSGEVTLSTRGLTTVELPPGTRYRLLSVIAQPSVALILMMIGIYGLILEFLTPGFGVPGTVGAICLLLAMFALQMLPFNYAGIALILLGIGLLVAEMTLPSFGVLGVGGIVAFIAGAMLMFDRDVPGMGVPLPLIIGLAASSAVFVLLGGGMALGARRMPVVSGREALVGASGIVEMVDGDTVWARVRGELWRVQTRGPVAVGQSVQVSAVEGLTLVVKTAADTAKTKGENR